MSFQNNHTNYQKDTDQSKFLNMKTFFINQYAIKKKYFTESIRSSLISRYWYNNEKKYVLVPINTSNSTQISILRNYLLLSFNNGLLQSLQNDIILWGLLRTKRLTIWLHFDTMIPKFSSFLGICPTIILIYSLSQFSNI